MFPSLPVTALLGMVSVTSSLLAAQHMHPDGCPIPCRASIACQHQVRACTLTSSLLLCCLQSSWPVQQYAAAVVAVHLTFALLEKTRLENFEKTGEVNPTCNTASGHVLLAIIVVLCKPNNL